MTGGYLYAAYGMNTSVEEMAARCPAATALGTAVIRGYRLAFRGVTDIVADPRRSVQVALWRITAACERALDRLEGYRADGHGLYCKVTEIIPAGRFAGRRVMLYQMTRGDLCPPLPGYEGIVRRGYADFGLPATQIDRALREARESARARAKAWPGGSLWDHDGDPA